MQFVTEQAPGKLNLALDVLSKRPDGYHEMRMLMQTVSLCDTVTLRLTPSGPWQLTCCDEAGQPGRLPQGPENLAYSKTMASSGTLPVRSPMPSRLQLTAQAP